MAGDRSTKPGSKRLWITITTLVSFLIGIPFWLKSTQVYRAPLPLEEIDSYASWASASTLQLPCLLNVVFATPDDCFTKSRLESVASTIRLHVQKLIHSQTFDQELSGQDGFNLQVTYDADEFCLKSTDELGERSWSCGLVTSGFLEALHVSDDDAVDDILRNYSNSMAPKPDEVRSVNDEGGIYTIVVLQKDYVHGMHSPRAASDTVSEGVCGDGVQNQMCMEKGNEFPTGVGMEKHGANWRTVVGKYRHGWIVGNFDPSKIESELLQRIGDVAVTFLKGSRGGRGEYKEKNMPLSADGEAILSFSLLNADPSDWIFDWDFEELKQQFFLPVVEALKGIAELTMESQVLYYTPKAVQSRWVASRKSYVVDTKQLPFFVNANEWHLDSSSAAAGRSKLLHFAIYVPGAKECPLQIQLKNGQLSATNGFTSPGWGGVVIYNPGNCTSVSNSARPHVHLITSTDFEQVASVIVAQIRTLFGLPPTSLKEEFLYLPANRRGFSDWELDVLLRRRAIGDMAASASTLMSLSRLVRKLSNMVIMDEIGDQVKSSLLAAAAARAHAARGAYYATAKAACTARSLAEAAFFQPSIMSVLYNPKEHHLAIYTPFFVPVLLHAVLAVIKEASRHRREWKRFKQKHRVTTSVTD